MKEVKYNLPTDGSVVSISGSDSYIGIYPPISGIANGGISIATGDTAVTVNIYGITFGGEGSTVKSSGFIDFSLATNNNNVLNFNGINVINANSAVVAGESMSAIRIPSNITLTINSGNLYDGFEASLTCIGATTGSEQIGAAGIGGASHETSGTIIINNSRTIKCTGGNGAAGIGGGYQANGGRTSITLLDSATLEAAGGYEGAGIGGGMGIVLKDKIIGANGGRITITGPDTSALTAIGGIEAAGIGGGSAGDSNEIIINGGITINASSEYGGAGIGGGAAAAIPSRYYGGGSGGIITINSSGNIIVSSIVGAGIGGGHLGNSGNITINTTGTIEVNVTQLASGIGAGAGFLFGTYFAGGDSETITLGGTGTIIVNGGQSYDEEQTPTELRLDGRYASFKSQILGGAGIGGGANGKGGTINITGSLNITANGNDGAAGIGGGTASTVGTITYGGDVDNIYIKGAKKVIAVSGSNILGAYGGAGIGGGSFGSGGKITIIDCADIVATGGNGGAGIGGGYEGCYESIFIMNNSGIIADGNNEAENIGNGYNSPITCNGTILVCGPEITGKNANKPDISKVQFIKNGLTYIDSPMNLVNTQNNSSYQLRTNKQGQLYFYSNSGTYSFEEISGNESLEKNSFTGNNVPKVLKFIRIIGKQSRGVNIFLKYL